MVGAQDLDKSAHSYFHAHQKWCALLRDTHFVENVVHAKEHLVKLLDSMETSIHTCEGDPQKARDISCAYHKAETAIAKSHGFNSMGELCEAFVMCMLFVIYQTMAIDSKYTLFEMLDGIIKDVTFLRPNNYPRLLAFLPGTDMYTSCLL